MKNIEEHVRTIVATLFGLDEKNISEYDSYVDDLGADSLLLLELIVALRREYKISDVDVRNITNIAQTVEYIRERL